jgi:hypothetical protein
MKKEGLFYLSVGILLISFSMISAVGLDNPYIPNIDTTDGTSETFITYLTEGNCSVLGACPNITYLNYDNSGDLNLSGDLTVNASTIDAITFYRDDTARMRFETYGTASVPYFYAVRGRGTKSSPSAIQSGDDLFILNAGGFYDSSHIGTGMQLMFEANENWSSGAQGTRLTLWGIKAGNSMTRWLTAVQGNFDFWSGNLTTTGNVSGSRYVSTVATGTEPYSTTSTTLNTNLNSDYLDGYHASYFYQNSNPYSFYNSTTLTKVGNTTSEIWTVANNGTFIKSDTNCSLTGTCSNITYLNNYNNGNLSYGNPDSSAGSYSRLRVFSSADASAGTNGIFDLIATRQASVSGSMDLDFRLSPGNGNVPSTVVYMQGDTKYVGFSGSTNPQASIQIGNGTGSAPGRIRYDAWYGSVGEEYYLEGVFKGAMLYEMSATAGNNNFTVYTGAGGSAPKFKIDGNGVILSQVSSTGLSGNALSSAVFEKNNHNYIEVLSPTNKQAGLIFGDGGADIGFISYDHSTEKMNLGTNGGNKVAIDVNGYLGVNKATPLYFLDVYSGSSVIFAQFSNNEASYQAGGYGGDLYLQSANSSGTGVADMLLTSYGGANIPLLSLIATSTYIKGYLGVNTSSPSYMADINGELRATTVRSGYIRNSGSSTNLVFQADSGDIYFRNSSAGIMGTIKTSTGSMNLTSLSGTGNAYACVDLNGQLYRSATACA